MYLQNPILSEAVIAGNVLCETTDMQLENRPSIVFLEIQHFWLRLASVGLCPPQECLRFGGRGHTGCGITSKLDCMKVSRFLERVPVKVPD
jgi:hypothetical protein